ncbi:C2 domain-containing protein [Hirschfeldia incana]|nr:C2 domain-containing protein [Hirschfeldia incana]
MAAKKDDFSVKKISPKLGGERGTRNPNGPTSSHDLVEQMEFLYVEVIKAINNSIVANTCNPIVEITLGNYKSSTKSLQLEPNGEWNQVFAFDKTKGDVLSVTLRDGRRENGAVIGTQNFKVAADIPFRVPPDARIAPQWYSMGSMELMMSIWFGTQADEVYPRAWFSDASDVSARCVVNTRPKLYLAPRLCYVRVTIVSGHDLICNDVNRTPCSVYVRATLGGVKLYTEVSSGSNPSWNQDLIFVASEPLDETVYITLFDKVNGQPHDECIGVLKKKLSEMTAVKVPGSAPALFYDIEPPVRLKPAGDSRRFASRIKMKLATDQAYHVFDECVQHSSDYRAFAKGLWPDLLGKLEIGILGATGLATMKEWRDGRRSTDAYVVAKYGSKWARTRTVVGNFSPKWNEQYSWDVFDKCTTVTFGIFDNRQLVLVSSSNDQMNDGLIGKVRIPLMLLEWDRVYTCSCPIMVLREDGLKKMGELQLAIRCLCVANPYVRWTSPFRWMLPKAHYKSPLSMVQTEDLRWQAIRLNGLNLARMEPPLLNEVVLEMLRPTNKSFSMRTTKANLERLRRVVGKMFDWCVWMNETVRSTTDFRPKIITCVASVVLVFGWWYWILWLAVWPVIPVYLAVISLREMFRFSRGEFDRLVLGVHVNSPPPLVPVDLKLWGLDSPDLDELEEEFDMFPSSVVDVDVLRMRYDRLRKEVGENVMLLLGDVASQCERLVAFLSLLFGSPVAWICFSLVCYVMVVLVYVFWDQVILIQKFVFIWLVVRWVNFQCFRNDLPSGVSNFFRRLPTNEGPMF